MLVHQHAHANDAACRAADHSAHFDHGEFEFAGSPGAAERGEPRSGAAGQRTAQRSPWLPDHQCGGGQRVGPADREGDVLCRWQEGQDADPRNRKAQWVLPMDVRRFAFGTHRVRVTVQFAKSSQTKAKTLRLSFSRCHGANVTPKFTG